MCDVRKPFLSIDLHMHSNASDGALSPVELIKLASRQKLQALALTDHDTVAGLAEAHSCARQYNITFINGVELSSSWQNKALHIVGLGIDPTRPELLNRLQTLQDARQKRAEKIALKLARKGISGALEGARQYARDGLIARPHFARFLVEQGFAKDTQQAFSRYLVRNKPAYVATQWPALSDTVRCIRQAGGVAVLAHPLRYSLTASWMRRLLTDFKTLGGEAIEVVCGHYTPTEITASVDYAHQFGLMGSVGSDFHNDSDYGCRPGAFKPLPHSVTPVWRAQPLADLLKPLSESES